MNKRNTYSLFQIPFSTRNQKDTLKQILEFSKKKKGSSVVFTNAHVIVEAQNRAQVLKALNSVSLVVPDGVPVAWVLQALGEKETERYSGPDLMMDAFKLTPKARHFFLGSTPLALERIKNKFKGEIAGLYSPPFSKEFSEEEKLKHLKMVDDSNADFIWIGLGAPKQELYVAEMSLRSKKGVWLAVGAAFDFYADLKPRAPKPMQTMGMEWFFRMVTEPRRLGYRYLTTNPVFIKLAIKELYSNFLTTKKKRPDNSDKGISE